jgi:hypothetical protein
VGRPDNHFAVFAGLAVLNFAALNHLSPLGGPERILALAARLANFMFLVLIAATALTRLAPVRKAAGIETFLAFSLAAPQNRQHATLDHIHAGVIKALRPAKDGAVCASACFLLFAAGEPRTAHPNSFIGVHKAADNDGRETYKSREATRAMVAQQLGVPSTIADKMGRTIASSG